MVETAKVPYKMAGNLYANNNREVVVVCARHVMKRPSKRSQLVLYYLTIHMSTFLLETERNLINEFLSKKPIAISNLILL